MLAAVLALGSADTGAVGALAPELERSFHIGNLEIGLMVTVSALTGAAAMLPVGWATDRWCRTRLLLIGVLLWGLAEGFSAAATSFTMLLLLRVGLGALTATTGPPVASLVGDFFSSSDRSRMYGFILTGDFLGAGLGLLIAGLVASVLSWQVAFVFLALPSLVLAWCIRRYLPEPARGRSGRSARNTDDAPGLESPRDARVAEAVKNQNVEPNPNAVLDRDPMTLSWWRTVSYVLRVHSNVTLIVASALGYFFFSGLETFAIIYLRGHYGLDQIGATVLVVMVGGAAVLGTILGGRLSDRLLRRGRLDGRLYIAAAGYLAAAIVLAPALLSHLVVVSAPLFVLAGFLLAAPNPGLDAARLDVVPARMWGRAEAIRSFLRSLLQALAPLLFGLTSVLFGGADQGLATGAQPDSGGTHTSVAGLEPTFLLMLLALLMASATVWRGRRSYPGDVAAAELSERRFPPE